LLQNSILDKIGLYNEVSGQSEPAATNAAAGRSVHWMGCFFHSAKDGVYHSPFLFIAKHVLLFFWFVLGRFSLDLTSNIITLFTFLPS
jgi:hypothetical protein